MNVTLDIGAVIAAIAWPVVVVVALLAFRAQIPILAKGLAGRVKKLEFAGVSIELAIAKPFVPDWTGSPTSLDLRQTATAVQVNDSTAANFSAQLTEEGLADYAVVNLGSGREWLTSRLYIFAIVFARIKGLKAFVFVENSSATRKRYVGWATPAAIRWSLAKRFPWLEEAYSGAYASIISQKHAFVVSDEGRLGTQWSTKDAGPSLELLREFLQRVQTPPLPFPTPQDAAMWVELSNVPLVKEHASWLTADELEEILGDDLISASVRTSVPGSKEPAQIRAFLSLQARYVAAAADDGRLEYMVDRSVLLEQLARQVASIEEP